MLHPSCLLLSCCRISWLWLCIFRERCWIHCWFVQMVQPPMWACRFRSMQEHGGASRALGHPPGSCEKPRLEVLSWESLTPHRRAVVWSKIHSLILLSYCSGDRSLLGGWRQVWKWCAPGGAGAVAACSCFGSLLKVCDVSIPKESVWRYGAV